MDRSHRIEAENDESLRIIEQLDDRSDLSSTYPQAHKEWEGQDVLSFEEREKKRAKDQEEITTSIRKWFVSIGVLIPVPFVLLVCLLSLGATYVDPKNAGFLLLPIIIGIGIWIAVSYLAIRRVHVIFYDHAMRTTPFATTLLCLLGICAQILFIVTRPLQTESFVTTSILISGLLVVSSIVLTGILLPIWVAPRLSTNAKFGFITALALALVGTAAAVTLL